LSAAGKVSPSKAMQHIHVKDSLDSSSQKLLDSSSPSMKKPASALKNTCGKTFQELL